MKTTYFIASILLITLFIVSCASETGNLPSADFDSKVDHALDYAVSQLKKSVSSVQDASEFPTSTQADGTWNTGTMYDWRSGHFPGCLWLAWEHSSDPAIKEAAVRWTESLEPVKDYTGNHDVGFMMFCSYGNGFRLTGNEAYRPIIAQSAQSLATRYKRSTGVIQSWNANERWKFPVIVDNMMNLELLFWASKESGYSELYLVAESHAQKTIENHIREDGSTFHVVDYDPGSGEVRGKYTHQGLAEDSVWSRGQAWGLYGFTMTYRETGDEIYLKTAQRLADYFIDNLPEDAVPYWDFKAPGIPDEPRDSSAAAIAASGLLELSTHVKDNASAEKYRSTALQILESLCSEKYLSEGTNSLGILNHGVGSKPHNSEVDVSLVYGDYYFLEALLRYKRGMDF